MTSDLNADHEAVVQHVTRAFAFLTGRARESREDDGSRTVIGFVAGEVLVEVELDWHECAAFTLVGIPVDGRRPGGYYVDEHGRKVRWHLVEAVDGSGDPGAPELARRLRSAARRSGGEAMMRQVDVAAEVVRRIWVTADLCGTLPGHALSDHRPYPERERRGKRCPSGTPNRPPVR